MTINYRHAFNIIASGDLSEGLNLLCSKYNASDNNQDRQDVQQAIFTVIDKYPKNEQHDAAMTIWLRVPRSPLKTAAEDHILTTINSFPTEQQILATSYVWKMAHSSDTLKEKVVENTIKIIDSKPTIEQQIETAVKFWLDLPSESAIAEEIENKVCHIIESQPEEEKEKIASYAYDQLKSEHTLAIKIMENYLLKPMDINEFTEEINNFSL